MIFFIIEKQKRSQNDFLSITTSAPAGKPTLDEKNIQLISWNEVPAYDSSIKFRQAVLTEAKKDPVCKDICKQALSQFGIDPFLEHCGQGNLSLATMTDILDKVFFQWSHPMIGNIGQSPHVRPELYYFQYIKNWDACPFLDKATKKSISGLITTLGPMDRSARDQVRICYTVTELARAIIGEITTVASRRLDKIFALKLCSSAELKTRQMVLIKKYLTAVSGTLKQKFVGKKGLGQSEYLRYYMPRAQNQAMTANNYEPQWYLYEHLIKISTGNWYKVTSTYTPDGTTGPIINDTIENIWKKMPGTIQCAVLMNSFRRFMDQVQAPPRYSMGLSSPEDLTNKAFPLPYQVVAAAAKSHVPAISFNSSSMSFTYSWNRDEYHVATITYRRFLLNLWGGPSGHGTGNVATAKSCLGQDLGLEEPNVILTGLFAFWRLFYDKRVSVVHTLAETMEGGLSYSGYNPNPKNCGTYTLGTPPDVTDDDAFTLIQKCTLARRTPSPKYFSYTDPIKLMQVVKKKYYAYTSDHQAAYDNLQTQIDTLRGSLTQAGMQVPQWSKELSQKQGMGVRSFAYSQTNTREDLARTMLVTAMVNQIVSNVIQKYETK